MAEADANAATAREGACIARAAAGDRPAFAALVRMHQSPVRRQLRHLTRGDLALADDLAQQTFVRAWTCLAQFRAEARFSTWLYKIAYREFLMHRRQTRSAAPAAHEAGDDAAGAAALEPDHAPALALRIDVERAPAALPSAERMAIVHCYHPDLSNEEAAEVLGLPLGTLKSHVLRGKARLRELLGA